MSEKPRLIIRKWIEKTLTGQLDSIELRVLEAIFMNIKSLRAVKYVTLNTTDMFKAGLHMSFKDLRLTIWALFGETVLLPGMTGGYRVLASVLIDEEKEEIRVAPACTCWKCARELPFATLMARKRSTMFRKLPKLKVISKRQLFADSGNQTKGD